MKILHLIYDDINNPWLGGGGAYRTLEIYKRMPKDVKITVVTGNYPGSKNERKENIDYLRLGSSFNYLISRITFTLGARKIIKKENYDLLIIDFSPYSPILAYNLTSKPMIASIQNIQAKHILKKFPLFGVIPFLLEKKALSKYSNFITVSKSTKEKLLDTISNESNKNIVIIPNGVSEDLLKGKLFIGKYLFFMGRIEVYQKGLDILLTAYNSISEKDKPPLIIAGTGPDLKKLKKENLKNKKIQFVGKLDLREKIKYLKNSLVLCAPSRFEAQPIVPLEAQAMGKPVLASKIPSMQDTIINNVTGRLYTPNNSEKLAKEIKKIISNKKEIKRLGKNARKYITKNFNWDSQTKKQLKFYKSVINNETK